MRAASRRAAAAIGGAALLAAALVGACADATAPDAVGGWGGTHVRLNLTAAASIEGRWGDVEFDCAHGWLTEGVKPGKSGAFDAAGMYVQEHGGPIRIDEKVDARPARYRGTIAGDEMTLTVSRTDTAFTIGPFGLRRGQNGSVFKCL